MSLGRIERKLCTLAASALVGAAALTAFAEEAHAQTAPAEGDPVSVTGKGIVGGALLGGEVVMLTMGIIGVESGWPYAVFGGLGAVAGGVGGFFIEEAADPTAEIPLYMLAGGMALVIPTLVVTLNAIAYKPPGDDKEPTQTAPAAEPPAPAGGSVTVTTSKATPARKRPLSARATQAPAAAPKALVDLRPSTMAFGLPAPEVKPLYTRREVATYGVEQGQQVRVPVFSATF
jgi:hypothetical protein